MYCGNIGRDWNSPRSFFSRNGMSLVMYLEGPYKRASPRFGMDSVDHCWGCVLWSGKWSCVYVKILLCVKRCSRKYRMVLRWEVQYAVCCGDLWEVGWELFGFYSRETIARCCQLYELLCERFPNDLASYSKRSFFSVLSGLLRVRSCFNCRVLDVLLIHEFWLSVHYSDWLRAPR